jgi:hypothetical protein
MIKLLVILGLVLSSCAPSRPDPLEAFNALKERNALRALQEENAPWIKDYIGKKGYFTLPIYDSRYNRVGVDRCRLAEIVEVHGPLSESLPINIQFAIKQDDLNATIGYVGGEMQTEYGGEKVILKNRATGESLQVAEFFKEKLPFGGVTQKRLCEGKYWTGMTKEQFKFVIGMPKKINTTVTRLGKSEQWVYGYGSRLSYYYFENNKLTAWQD